MNSYIDGRSGERCKDMNLVSLVHNLSSCEIEACFILSGGKNPVQSIKVAPKLQREKTYRSHAMTLIGFVVTQSDRKCDRVQSSKCGLWKSPRIETEPL